MVCLALRRRRGTPTSEDSHEREDSQESSRLLVGREDSQESSRHSCRHKTRTPTSLDHTQKLAPPPQPQNNVLKT